jgi:hypothetical protein
MEPAQRKRWLAIPDAAIELGVSEATLRTWCNARPPRIEHKREGTRGRKKLGTILIDRAVIEAHNAKQTIKPATAANRLQPCRPKRQRVFCPHQNRHIEVLVEQAECSSNRVAEGYSGALSP